MTRAILQWEMLVEEKYDEVDLEVITSVRGGKGCWYYQNDKQVNTFVLAYDPDLVIIGGISHRKDTASIHRVIDQIRAGSDAEILLMSGPVGRQGDLRTNADFNIPPASGDFRLELADLSDRVDVGYIDMKSDWGRYIQSSGQLYDYFLRDPVHANARGRQVLARLMAHYFGGWR
ncbi:MAG: SGNH/GDSL hydrolase family protein [Saprospiraceae bacterium]|nr:SGNH/GDSL hydrolase family protein [Saprospiraceae bacterium]